MTAKHRYAVYMQDQIIAVVHAHDSDDAVRIACKKTDGYDPACCIAVLIENQLISSSPKKVGGMRVRIAEMNV